MKTIYIYNAHCDDNHYPYAVTLDHNQFLYANQSLDGLPKLVDELKEDLGWRRDKDIKTLAFTLSEETNPELFI